MSGQTTQGARGRTIIASVVVAAAAIGIYFLTTSLSANPKGPSGSQAVGASSFAVGAASTASGRASSAADPASPLPTSGPTSGPMPGAPVSLQSALAATPTAHAQGTGAPGAVPIEPNKPMLVKTWNDGPGGKALATVTTQSGDALMAYSAKQYVDMLQYCGALTSALQNAVAAPAIPDAAMQAKYATSLTAFKAGAADCTAAITQSPNGVEDTVTHVDQTTIAKSHSELSEGEADLYVATETLRQQ